MISSYFDNRGKLTVPGESHFCKKIATTETIYHVAVRFRSRLYTLLPTPRPTHHTYTHIVPHIVECSEIDRRLPGVRHTVLAKRRRRWRRWHTWPRYSQRAFRGGEEKYFEIVVPQ